MLTEHRLQELATEAYDEFYANCEQEAIERHEGDTLRGLNEMQGFDYPDCVRTGDEMRDWCADHDSEVPQGAIGVLCLGSVSQVGGFFFASDSEAAAKEAIGTLYE